MDQVAKLQKIISEKIPENLVLPRHTEREHWYEYTPLKELYPSVTGITGIMASAHLRQWAANEVIRYLLPIWESITPENKDEHFQAAQLAHTDVLKEAGDIGTQTHGALNGYVSEWIKTGERPSDIKSFVNHEDIRIYATVRSAALFFNDFYLIPIVSEMRLASPKYKYGGTMDCLAFVGKVINEGNAGRTGFAKCPHLWGESRKGKDMECFHCGRRLRLTLTLLDWKSSNSIDHDEYAEQLSAYAHALFEMTGVRVKDLWIVRLDKTKARYEVARVTDRAKAFRAFLHTKHKYDWINDGVTKLYPVVEKEIIKLN